MRFDMSESELAAFEGFVQDFLSDVQQSSALMNNKINEILVNTRYNRLQKWIMNMMDQYNDLIEKQLISNTYDVWMSSDGSFVNLMSLYQIGEDAEAVCRQVQDRLGTMIGETLKVDALVVEIDTSNPIISLEDYESVNSACTEFINDLDDISNVYNSKLSTSMDDNDIYRSLPGLINGIKVFIENFVQAEISAVEKEKNEVQQIAERIRKANEELTGQAGKMKSGSGGAGSSESMASGGGDSGGSSEGAGNKSDETKESAKDKIRNGLKKAIKELNTPERREAFKKQLGKCKDAVKKGLTKENLKKAAEEGKAFLKKYKKPLGDIATSITPLVTLSNPALGAVTKNIPSILEAMTEDEKSGEKTADKKAAEKKTAEGEAEEKEIAERMHAEDEVAEKELAEEEAEEKKIAERMRAEDEAVEKEFVERMRAEDEAAEKELAENEADEKKAAENEAEEKDTAERELAEEKVDEKEAADGVTSENAAEETKPAKEEKTPVDEPVESELAESADSDDESTETDPIEKGVDVLKDYCDDLNTIFQALDILDPSDMPYDENEIPQYIDSNQKRMADELGKVLMNNPKIAKAYRQSASGTSRTGSASGTGSTSRTSGTGGTGRAGSTGTTGNRTQRSYTPEQEQKINKMGMDIIPALKGQPEVARAFARQLPQMMDCMDGNISSAQDSVRSALGRDCMSMLNAPQGANGMAMADRIMSNPDYRKVLGLTSGTVKAPDPYGYDFDQYDSDKLNSLSPIADRTQVQRMQEAAGGRGYENIDLSGIENELKQISESLKDDKKSYVEIPDASELGKLMNEIRGAVGNDSPVPVLSGVDGRYDKGEISKLASSMDHSMKSGQPDPIRKGVSEFVGRDMGYPAMGSDGRPQVNDARELIPLLNEGRKDFTIGDDGLNQVIRQAAQTRGSSQGHSKRARVCSSLASDSSLIASILGVGALFLAVGFAPVAAIFLGSSIGWMLHDDTAASYAQLVTQIGDKRADELLDHYDEDNGVYRYRG